MKMKLKDTFKNIKSQAHAYINAFPVGYPEFFDLSKHPDIELHLRSSLGAAARHTWKLESDCFIN